MPLIARSRGLTKTVSGLFGNVFATEFMVDDMVVEPHTDGHSHLETILSKSLSLGQTLVNTKLLDV